MREETLRMERVTYREQGVTQLENFSMSIWASEIMGLMPVNRHGISALIKLSDRICRFITGTFITMKSRLTTGGIPTLR